MALKQRQAVIDIGTLKVKSLLADFDLAGNIAPIHKTNVLTCFGCSMLENNGRISPENLNATIAEIINLLEIFANYQCGRISIFATHALRDASNKEEVLKEIRNKIGLEVKVLTPEAEGQLYFQAAVASLPAKQNFVVVDMGGGSCQVLFSEHQQLKQAYSFKTGGQLLHERFTKDPHNPASKNQPQDIASIKQFLTQEYHDLPLNLGWPLVYGSSNVIDLMKAVNIPLEDYFLSLAHPYKTYPNHLEDFIQSILPFSFAQREQKYQFQEGYMWGVDKAFANIITLAQRFASHYIIHTNVSSLEGYLYKLNQV